MTRGEERLAAEFALALLRGDAKRIPVPIRVRAVKIMRALANA